MILSNGAIKESEARTQIGRIFGKGEQTSTTGQYYEDYYGGWYDKNYP
jgi:type VI secretion system secreted protein VgrG